MKEIPKMISTKDASYINDIFNWNMTAFKKLSFYESVVSDEKIATKFAKIAGMHTEICETLINILEGGN